MSIKPVIKTRQEYAVYKGDELLCTGTAFECAEVLKVSPHTIRWLSSPAAEKRSVGKNCKVAVKLN